MDSEMASTLSTTWNNKMPKGLKLEVTRHPPKMKCLVNIVIALERLKGSSSQSVFRDENLLSLVLESIVEEHLVLERQSAATDEFNKMDEYPCNVTDAKKKSLVMVPDSMKLHAIMLQGGNDHHKVYLNMSTYVRPSLITEAIPVALCIKDTHLYLSCCKEDAEPTLHLEFVEDKSVLSNIGSDSDMMRFLFYKRDTGLNISTLMSARFPDWYISTEESDNNPVEMCQESAQRYRTFTIQRQS